MPLNNPVNAIEKSVLTTIGDIIAASAVNTPSRVAAPASGLVLTGQGAGVLPAWAAAASGTPTLKMATVFETTGRFGSVLVGSGAKSFNVGGALLRTGTTNPSSVDMPFGVGSSDFPPAASNNLFTSLFTVTEGADYQAFVGLGVITVAGAGLTFNAADANHYGFKSVCASSSTTFSATNGKDSTETATSLALPTLAVPNILLAKKTGTTNIKYYVNRVLGATHTTNLPSGNFANVGRFAISNVNTAADSYLNLHSYCYEQDAE